MKARPGGIRGETLTPYPPATKALCEASKYFFYLRYESGPLYRPASRDFQLVLQDISPAEAKRLRAIWDYWEETPEESGEVIDEQLHPDHLIPH